MDLKEPLVNKPPKQEKQRKYLEGNFFYTYGMMWVTKMIEIGNKKPFQQDMHWPLRDNESSHYLLKTAKEKWQRTRNPGIVKVLFSIHKRMIFVAILTSLLAAFAEYTGPLIINLAISYVEQPDRDIQYGILLVAGVAVSRFLQAFLYAQSDLLTEVTGINLKNSMTAMIYDKITKFSLMRAIEHSTGSIVNHVQVDADKIYNLCVAIGGSIIMPLQIGFGVYLTCSIVGKAFLAGVGVIVVMGLVNVYIGSVYYKYQKIVMEKKDERMKITNEAMGAIKYIKMLGWEEIFLQKIYKARDNELSFLKRQFLATAFSIFALWLTPMLMTTAIFGFYIFSGHDLTAADAFTVLSVLNILTGPIRALPSIITMGLEAKVAMARVDKFLKAEELTTKDLVYTNDPTNPIAIKIENGSFYWLSAEEKKKKQEAKEKEEKEKEKKNKKEKKAKKKEKTKKTEPAEESKEDTEANKSLVVSSNLSENLSSTTEKSEIADSSEDQYVLKDLDIEIKRGEFVAILGDVGSGKSSFLYSLLGEMKYDENNPPKFLVNGSIAYVGQQPWIQNTTVKKNILFGKEYDEQRYSEAIYFSNLKDDLKVLVKRDETEIGEKGVNLSGGQKARVSLARALYFDPDIYLLDDPLSAVDAHVGNFILEECFATHLRNKTRVLITHKVESLKYVDYIYVLQKGRIVAKGTLDTLNENKIFTDMINKFKLEVEESAEEKVEEGKEKKENEISLEKPKKEADNTSLGMTTQTTETTKPLDPDEKEIIDKLMLDEDREIGEVSGKVWWSYFKYYGGYFYFFIVIFVMTIWIALMTGSNFWLAYWSDNIKTGENSNSYFFGIYCWLALSFALFCLIRALMLLLQSLKCSRTMHNDMIARIIRAPVNLFFDRVPIGRLLNRFSKDLTTIDNYIAVTFGSTLVCIFSVLADIVVCLIAGSFYIFPLVLICFWIGVYFQKRYMKVNREVTRLENISKSPVVSFFSESLNGLTYIRAYNKHNEFIDKYLTLQDENIKNLILRTGLGNWFSLRITLCTILVQVPTVLIPLIISVPNPNASGIVGLLMSYVLVVNDDMLWTLRLLSEFESKLINFERCRAFTQVEKEREPKTKEPEKVANFSASWPERGEVEFRNYSTRYRPNLPLVIKNLSCTIKSGEKVGIVGRTGSGKSTLFLSLCRIIEPENGSIFIDGVNISEIGLDDLRRKITIVPQDPMLFKGTIRENMDVLNKYTDEEIWMALERVCLKEKFEKDQGLKSEIKDSGGNLSAGEKQLLCIGRAILEKNKIILIDEATSNIDPRTEQTILKTIHDNFTDCTVITIAHRLKTVIESDRILVMSNGEKLEFDSPKNLLADESSYFYNLWKEHEKNTTLD